ncbi:MAG: hypothetical protein A3C85_03030 [Candidatus Doudnabacteria bacterium RIFCSPHIGHO2_02_FULL_48_21]|uniref:DUF305 domain-containing protein n=1 Tax=Candidatus Doudnabacteria bacterium RIFCSPLOWO2_02_FULL_48_13 TaxID=1817845 RepID=A0A1F5QC10_9BACT|nr:MAG: hypothetical protein A3K05_00290 [Candidatus Doudnabacteria bacterium RIFCSPHIGHO2_01_48_18]OGE77081.1 MAG: hypothetical protein A2668_02400 [Candidatus Doudnabacteria bacterium RIFCSPHIGHO2_01_FULL_48_180]OGE91622.1 MAG: hypothetical protein A3F44_02860 [Candidatus Doudnabacteria bacterium RIFCSPHIGHO2_12_FULL_47_25]OGE93236.1 MAG: hypothetical protein A3C85_03030 [Candidatus Doudnabacteria bacterium RIFCSPHIGHO2_02_FULL_48_21]OGE96359.1 MAG: hypothetical protein A3A83_01275 [Candidatu
MNNNPFFAGAVGFVAGIVLTMFVFPSWSMTAGPMRGMMNWRYDGNNMMGSNMNRNMDEHFIEQMIPHHEDAITMANIALEKTQRQEIKGLAEDIVRTQTAEIEQMKSWYEDWFSLENSGTKQAMAHGMMNMGMMGDNSDIDRLETAVPFDKAFIEEMIPHHQMAVMMAQMLERTTARPEMKKLAGDIITAQTREINQMREWYRSWYQN